MIDLKRKLSPKSGECDTCGKPRVLFRHLSLHLCLDCLTEEEIYIKASEDWIEAFNKKYGR